MCGLELEAYTIVTKTRVDRTVFDYEYTVTLHNTCPTDTSDVRFNLVTLPDNVTLLDINVVFPSVPAAHSKTGNGTFTIRVDHSAPGGAEDMVWHTVPYLLADVTRNGEVDFLDAAMLADYWLTDEKSVDIAPNGVIDFFDFAIIGSRWRE